MSLFFDTRHDIITLKLLYGGVRLERTAAERKFAYWLTAQTNSRGLPYRATVAHRYAACRRTEPLKLDIPLSAEERDTYRCRTLQNFGRLNKVFRTAPNFQEVDRKSDHGTFSAGLSAYRRYVCETTLSKNEIGLNKKLIGERAGKTFV